MAFPRIDQLGFGVREDREEREEEEEERENKSNRWTVLKCTKSVPLDGDYFYFLFHVFNIWEEILAVPAWESQV